MSNRVTRQVAENQFKRLCDALGKRVATSYNDVGAWQLNYAQCYGGYQIQEIVTSTGGISEPFSSSRMSGKELYDYVNFALRAIQIDRLNGKDSAQYWPADKENTHV